MFPNELWENILQYVDVLDLLNLKCVSKSFNQMITVIIEDKCKWYEKCQKEVPESFWSVLLKHQIDPEITCIDFHRSKSRSPIWIAMYKSWVKGWSVLTEKTSSSMTLSIFANPNEGGSVGPEGPWIRAVDALSNIVAIGDITNRLIFYNISKLDEAPFIHQSQHRWINEIRLCQRRNYIMAVVSFINGNVPVIQYWNLKSRRLVRETRGQSPKLFIGASYDFCCTVEKCIEPNPHYTLNIERFGNGVVRSIDIPLGAHEDVQSLFMEGTKVMLTTKSYSRVSKIHTITMDNYTVRDVGPCLFSHPVFKFLSISIAVALNYIFACSTIGFCVIGSKNWKYYEAKNQFPANSYIMSIVYHAGLLIFGMASGELRVVQVGEIERVPSFNSETMRGSKNQVLQLDSQPIEHLQVTECNFTQYIVAGTCKKVHVVKFE